MTDSLDKTADEAALLWMGGKVESFSEGVERVEKRKAKRGKRLQDRLTHATFPLTELGNAERLVAKHGHEMRFCAGLGWLVFDARRWQRDLTGEVERRAKETVRALFAQAADIEDTGRRTELIGHAFSSEKAAKLRAMISLATTEAAVAITPDALDRDPWRLNLATGTIDLRTGKAHPHRAADLITKIADVVHDPQATCPTWLACLERWLPDLEVRAFLQRWVGYALTGDVREQVLLFLYGLGANGKSTFLNVLHELLGDYARQGAPELLLARRDGMSAGDASALADLHGARLVVCVELGDGRSFDEVTIKQLTGGDVIKAKLMRQDWFSFAPTFKIVVAANHKPNIRGTDHAIWRRMRLVPFTQTIPDADRDPELPAKLRAELPGILRWAVDGCLEWQTKGLGLPDAVSAATAGYRAEQDVLGDFFAERCVFDADARVARPTLRQAYELWAKENGYDRPLGPKAFAERLRERSVRDVAAMRVPDRAHPVAGWLGVRLRTGFDVETYRHVEGKSAFSSSLARDERVIGESVSTSLYVSTTPSDDEHEAEQAWRGEA